MIRLLLLPEVCSVKPTNRKSWAVKLLMLSHLTFGPFFKVKWRQPNLEVLITHLLQILKRDCLGLNSFGLSELLSKNCCFEFCFTKKFQYLPLVVHQWSTFCLNGTHTVGPTVVHRWQSIGHFMYLCCHRWL